MKSHQRKLHLVHIWTLLLLSLPFSSALSQNLNFSSQEENFPIAVEDERQLKSSLPTTSGKSSFLLSMDELTLHFLPYERHSVVYYANQEHDPVYINIRLGEAFSEAGKRSEEAIKLALEQGQMLKGRFWPGTDFQGEGQEISLEIKKIDNSYVINKYPVESRKTGKYIIEIENLWEFSLELKVFKGLFKIGDQFNTWPQRKFPQNFEGFFEFDPDVFQTPQLTFEILTTAPGKWYLWIDCSGYPVSLIIENGRESPAIIEIPKGGSYSSQETIEKKAIEAGEDQFRRILIVSPTKNLHYDQRKCLVSSVLRNEPEFRNYELQEDLRNLTVTYWEQNTSWAGPMKGMVVRFSPLKLQEMLLTDSVGYSLELVWEDPETIWAGVLVTERPIPFPIYYQKQIELSFIGMTVPTDGEVFVKVKAYVKCESKTIRVFTYPIGYVNLNDTSFKEKEQHSLFGKREVGIAAVGIVSLIFVVAAVVLGFKKVAGRSRRPVVVAEEREEEAFEDEGERNGINEEDRSVIVVERRNS